jgi:nucleotide-binding universal stress UspA family protein
MDNRMTSRQSPNLQEAVILVAVDFSDCSRLALRKAKLLLGDRPGCIIALHVIDHDFIAACLRRDIADEGNLKKQLFMNAKHRLKTFLQEEVEERINVEPVICEGIPYMEINRKALQYNAEMIVMGSCGMACDPNAIFFGGTTEKVLRFISRPVLCMPPEKN